MLGKHVCEVAKVDGHDVVGTGHRDCPIEDGGAVFRAVEAIQPDVIINCAGRIPGHSPLEMLPVNALGPHILASTGVRLVHMSTDCVFSGRSHRHPYTPEDLPDPVDIYGKTKLAGEPLDCPNALVVRGSFIGRESGFLAWLLQAKGQVEAWEKAFWNGLTVRAMSGVLVYLAHSRQVGLVHAASETAISKAEMVNFFVKHLDLPIQSIRYMSEPRIDRRLEPDPEIRVTPLLTMFNNLAEELCPISA